MAGIEKEMKKAFGGKTAGSKKSSKKSGGGSVEKKVAKSAKRLLK